MVAFCDKLDALYSQLIISVSIFSMEWINTFYHYNLKGIFSPGFCINETYLIKKQENILSTKSRLHVYRYSLRLIRNYLQEYGPWPFFPLRKCWKSETAWKLYNTTLAISHYILLGTVILPLSPAQSRISINLAEGLSSLPDITTKLHNTTLSFCQNMAPSDKPSGLKYFPFLFKIHSIFHPEEFLNTKGLFRPSYLSGRADVYQLQIDSQLWWCSAESNFLPTRETV